MTKARDKQKEVERVAWEVEEKVTAVDEKAPVVETRSQEAVSQALVKYKTSQAYIDDLANGSSSTVYRVGFGDCKDAIAWIHPEIDLSGVQQFKEDEDATANDVEHEDALAPEEDP
ncbi:putative receptor-like protein kinase [Cocos nucifera]|nr:putative receptor-like protein kinase [Cocos nucifera]